MTWIQKWDVIGSTGNHYTVAKSDNGEFGCSCPAWKFNRIECKHIRGIKSQVASTASSMRAARKGLWLNSPVVEEPRQDGKWYL